MIHDNAHDYNDLQIDAGVPEAQRADSNYSVISGFSSNGASVRSCLVSVGDTVCLEFQKKGASNEAPDATAFYSTDF